jgi:hypothetical protein
MNLKNMESSCENNNNNNEILIDIKNKINDNKIVNIIFLIYI